jgi:hypothetical protein
VLEDDLDRLPKFLELLRPEAGDVLPAKQHLAAIGVEQEAERPRQGGLTTTAFAHDPQDLAGVQLQTDAVQGGLGLAARPGIVTEHHGYILQLKHDDTSPGPARSGAFQDG